ncbi:hypothetical protein BU16DRAFT_568193 [Lophium mytilinum]|uniref:F-box domain-containing protein n=1 Tax=Lophium mytilinum TaxID=390894 RepID=A0A6A6Q9M4_9PEZI|nr:hypothetical protein BU16DRAFT_568193 [Lophium mytilinum]
MTPIRLQLNASPPELSSDPNSSEAAPSTTENAAQGQLPAFPLLKLPLDLLLCVTDKLPLADNIALAQTSQVLRNTFQPDCEKAARKFKRHAVPAHNAERLELLAGLANSRADVFSCSFCNMLHSVDTRDTPRPPYLTRHYPCQILSHENCLDSKKWKDTHHRFGIYNFDRHASAGEGYCLAHHHVQLALKFSRLKTANPAYLANLLATYTGDKPQKKLVAAKRPTFAKPGQINSFIARPRVVKNHFLLSMKWEFYYTSPEGLEKDIADIRPQYLIRRRRVSLHAYDTPSGNTSPTGTSVKETYYDTAVVPPSLEATLPPRNFCPHLKFDAQHVKDGLARTSHGGNVGQQKAYHSCEHCPTDYCVELLPDRVVFEVWQDLGSNGPPTEEHWQACAFGKGSVTHKAGSVRESFVYDDAAVFDLKSFQEAERRLFGFGHGGRKGLEGF